MKHLPDERDWDHMDRKWLSDVVYTTAKADFERIITEAVKARKERLEEKNGLSIHMRPEFAQAFHNCMNFSSNNVSNNNYHSSRKRPRIEPFESLI